MKKLSWRTIHLLAIIPMWIALLLMVYAPDWIYTVPIFIVCWGWSAYYYFAFVFGLFGLGRKIKQQIVEEDEAYRDSLKPVPIWERPIPKSKENK